MSAKIGFFVMTSNNGKNFFCFSKNNFIFVVHFKSNFLLRMILKTCQMAQRHIGKALSFYSFNLKIWRLEDMNKEKSQMFACMRGLDRIS